MLDPKTSKVSSSRRRKDPDVPEAFGPGHAAIEKPLAASAYWGMRADLGTKFDNHNDMIDGKGNVWMTGTNHAPGTPAFCRKGSDNPYAKAFPLEATSGNWRCTIRRRRSSPSSTPASAPTICNSASTRTTPCGPAAPAVAGWVDSKVFAETGSAEKAQGWAPFVLDTNGNGKLDDYTEPGKPMDPNKDMRVAGSGTYAVMPNPVDGSIWYTWDVFAGKSGIIRFDPKTKLSEVYNIPMPGFGPRGGDIDSKGVVWVSLASGHLGSFDRSKVQRPAQWPEGDRGSMPGRLELLQISGPGFQGLGDNSAEASYYTWVDQHNAVGLGKDVPISTADEKTVMRLWSTAKW